MTRPTFKYTFAAVTLALILSGCGGDGSQSLRFADQDESSPRSTTAVITAVSSDFASGQVELLEVADGPMSTSRGFNQTISDIVVSTHESSYFLIERFGADRISRIDADNLSLPQWQYSTVDSADDGSSNPAKLIIASEQKGYLLRYGSNEAWIVDPSTRREDAFKLGVLDLSDYVADNADGSGFGNNVPNMIDAVISNGQLFIALQRLDSNFSASNTSYVAVFDVSTDTEIDTGKGENGLRGIPLNGRNPNSIQALPGGDLAVVSEGFEPFMGDIQFTGGIDLIGDDFSVTALTSDSADSGRSVGLAVIDNNQGLLRISRGFDSNSVVRINLATGERGDTLGDLQQRPLRDIAIGPDQRLWVADAAPSNPAIRRYDVTSGEQFDVTATELLPQGIGFINE